MEPRRENHLYDGSGLTNLTLLDVEVRYCPSCGENGVVVWRVEALHRAIAAALMKKPGRLDPGEIRFLRSMLDLTGVDLALRMGVTPESVSRWENGKEPIGPVADRLLRLMVAHAERIRDYPLDELAGIARVPAKSARWVARMVNKGWRVEPAAT